MAAEMPFAFNTWSVEWAPRTLKMGAINSREHGEVYVEYSNQVGAPRMIDIIEHERGMRGREAYHCTENNHN